MLYLSRDSHQELYTFIQTKWQCFKCLLYLLLGYDVLTKGVGDGATSEARALPLFHK